MKKKLGGSRCSSCLPILSARAPGSDKNFHLHSFPLHVFKICKLNDGSVQELSAMEV